MDVSEPASISTGIAARYASAVFDIAKEGKALAALEKDIDALDAALTDSADLVALISSPLYSRDEQAGAIAAVAIGAGVAGASPAALAQKQYGPGVTDKEIKIGNIMPYSGPASAYGAIG
ncbi:MAG: hypothetical protein EBT13_07670, partial [Rhodobacteraceae bacterium]|nr:hypothetical protein [Paracoccaceae bacterium]